MDNEKYDSPAHTGCIFYRFIDNWPRCIKGTRP
jgi:hypothetical protein